MRKQLTVKPPLFTPDGVELIIDLKNHSSFYPEDIKLEKFENRKNLTQKENIAGIGHLQALLENPSEIPQACSNYISLAPGSVFKNGLNIFIPALINNGFIDAVALSNRDIEWEIVLIDISSPVSRQERVIILQ